MGLFSFLTRSSAPPADTEAGSLVTRGVDPGINQALAWSMGAPGTTSRLFAVMPSSTGEPVTPQTALSVSTAYACVRRLGEDIGKLPILVRRRLPQGGYQTETKHPLARLFRKPNRWMTGFEFKASLFSMLALKGNSYACILRRGDGTPYALVPLNPSAVSPMLAPDGTLYYYASHPALGTGLVFHQDDMIHLRGMTLDGGYIGISPIYAAPDVFGLAMATQKHGAVLFRQGAQVPAFLKHPGKISPEAQANLVESLARRHAGVENAYKFGLLEEGMEIEKIGLTAEESQFLQTRKLSIPEICRMFGVPPHKVFDLSDAHYANIEASNQQYVDDTLDPNCRRAAEEFEDKLLFADEQDELEIGFDYNALLRGDRKSRYEANSKALSDGWKNRNEVRAEEGLGPIPGGDRYLVRLDQAGDVEGDGDGDGEDEGEESGDGAEAADAAAQLRDPDDPDSRKASSRAKLKG